MVQKEFIVLGRSPGYGEQHFVISPKRFCLSNGLSPCQGGIVTYLSRFYFERNPWLLDQSLQLINFILDFDDSSNSLMSKAREYLGLKVYLAPPIKEWRPNKLSVAAFCAINGLGPEYLLPLSLVCNEPTRSGIERTKELIDSIRR